MSDFEQEQKEKFSIMYNKQLFETFKRCNEIKINCYCNFGQNNDGLNKIYLTNFKKHCKTKKHILYIDEEYENDK